MINITNDVTYINECRRINEVSDYEKEKLYNVIVECFDYQKLSESLTRNNLILGKLYLNKNIKNISLFLKYNENNYNVDEIGNFINENCKSDEMFNVLFDYLKNHTLSGNVWKKIVKNNCDNIERLTLLFNNFGETENYASIIVPAIIDKRLINDINKENENNKSNEEERNRLYSEQTKLKNKNFIIRLFQRKKVKDIEIKIKEIESKIQKSIDNIKELENDISDVKKKIKDNENSLLEKYGISISEYKTLLDEISKDNLTEEEIAKRILEIQKKIQALNIRDREKEIQDIYEKNSVILNNENVIEQDNNLKK